jgi:hypothetical protein
VRMSCATIKLALGCASASVRSVKRPTTVASGLAGSRTSTVHAPLARRMNANRPSVRDPHCLAEEVRHARRERDPAAAWARDRARLRLYVCESLSLGFRFHVGVVARYPHQRTGSMNTRAPSTPAVCSDLLAMRHTDRDVTAIDHKREHIPSKTAPPHEPSTLQYLRERGPRMPRDPGRRICVSWYAHANVSERR